MGTKLEIVFCVLAFVLGMFLIQNSDIESSPNQANRPLFAPPSLIKYFSFGYNEIIADSLWLRVIQDIDYCERAPDLQEQRKRESDEFERMSEEDKRRYNLPPALSGRKLSEKAPACDRGWVFHFIDAITELAPKFRMPYSAGATVMSILVDDREGARLIYEKGIRQFPDDWTMAYRAAYHYLYEVDDPSRAAELLLMAEKKGAPDWVRLLASRLLTVSGRTALAKSVLEEALATAPPGPARDRIVKRLEEVEAALRKAKESGKN